MSETEQTSQPPAPVVVNEPTQIADGVYVIPDGRVPLVPNVGIVVGDRSVLVVDPGMGPRNGDVVRRHAEKLADGKPLFVTATHFHPEHGYGVQSFRRGATIVYNRTQLDEFRDKGRAYLEMFRTFGDSVAEQLDGVELVEPDLAYGGDAELDLGGRRVRLHPTGLAHTRGDQVVFLPDERILFTGDLVESRCFAIFPYFPPDDADVDGDRWIAVLEQLERLEAGIVVPGHGEVGDVSAITTARDYIAELGEETRRLAGEGLAVDEIVERLDREFRERHPDWVQQEWIAFGVRCFFNAIDM